MWIRREPSCLGIGSGLTIQLTNASNGGRGLDVVHSGVGPGVFAVSTGGNAVWGIASNVSAAGVIGDNATGEAVVGRSQGGNGIGAVVGRNDDLGYGVRGFNTDAGIGVIGQAGISGGTGVGGRFENVNAANTNDTLVVSTNSLGVPLRSARAAVRTRATSRYSRRTATRSGSTGRGSATSTAASRTAAPTSPRPSRRKTPWRPTSPATCW